ncbi:MAG: carboxylesterase family protein [Paludibacteraceae bacterium]|nr:carboxylesterase family protein [Paludibacteraceae bacterium]
MVVCISYRLGALGFLYEPDRGIQNLGIADQTVALQWIRRYIVQFGGDPQRITVAGQSAGAFSIACLIASLQENLFQKAVMMSMPFLPIPARLMTRVDRLWRKQLNADPATASVHKLVRAQLSAGRLSHLPLPFAPCGYHPFRPQRIMPGLREALVMSTADDAYPFCPSPSLVPLVTQVVFNHPIQGYSDRLKRLGVAVQQDTLRWLHGTSEFGDAHGIDFTLLFSQWQHWKDLPLYRTVSEEEYNRHARRLRQRILSLVKG